MAARTFDAPTLDCTCRPDSSDPRIDSRFVRHVDDGDGEDVVLVGVVHDHPSSAARVQSILDAHGPDVLALELPTVAVPLFEEHADDERTPPRFGGEMSAAIQAADGARVAGIDAPSGAFLREVAATVRRERPSAGTVTDLLRGFGAATRHALGCWIAAQLTRRTQFRVAFDDGTEHGCDVADPPEVQAADESAHVSRAVSLFRALDRPEPVRIRDETREACMAREIEALRRDGSVVAVVGHGHLDALAERLDP